jgi:hypothetical protein
MPGHRRRWVWTGRVVCLLLVGGLVTYLVSVGLDRADKIASGVGAVLALAALVAPYLLAPADRHETAGVRAGGAAAVAIGGPNTGEVTAEASGPVPPVTPAAETSATGTSATGAAAVAIGGKNKGPIRTRYTGRGRAG